VPVEVIEARSPIVVVRKEYIPDSGGAGRTRGGLGQRVVIRRAPGWSGTIRTSASLDHDRFPPDGILGGAPGAPSRFGLLDPSGTLIPQRIHLATLTGEADRLVVEVAGGGGYGDPADRSPDAIAADLRAGYLTDPSTPGSTS
jgi:N-methylhydantoinase B/oxoprolinase/acetone carboxylase alpha subunit